MNLCSILTYDTGKVWKVSSKTEDKNQLGANYSRTVSGMEMQSYLRSWFNRTC